MEQNKVDMYIIANQKYFPADKLWLIKEKMLAIDENKFYLISAVDLKDPTVILIFSILLGSWGIDRFMLEDIGMGILKLLTGGVFGILTIIDWFITYKKAKEINFNNFMTIF